MSKVSMQLSEQIEDKLNALGLDLVEVQQKKDRKGHILQVTINYSDGHVGLSHCQAASRSLNELIDTFNDPLSWKLEVYSPGVGRQLKTARDYEIFRGKLVEVRLKDTEVGFRVGRISYSDEYGLCIEVDNSEEKWDWQHVFMVNLAQDKPAEEDKCIEVSLEDV